MVIVDDQLMFSEALRVLLERDGGISVVATPRSGPEALEIAAAEDVDVVLMDVGLDGMSGLEATRALLALRPDARVIVVSGRTPDEIEADAFAAGASACITKGGIGEEVVAAIRQVAAACATPPGPQPLQ